MPPLTRTALAWLSLVHHPGRLAVSTAGVALAVVLMLMQVGFRQGMFDSQAALITQLNADLVLINNHKEMLNVGEAFPRSRLRQAAGVAGVRAAYPVYMERIRATWRSPGSRSARAIRVIAFDPADPVFRFPQPELHARALQRPDTVLFDTRSREYFGDPRPGTTAELAGRRVEVVGTFELGTDFLSDGSVIVSDQTFLKLFPDAPVRRRAPDGDTPPRDTPPRRDARSRLNQVDIGVLQLEPSADPRQVQARLRAILPGDVLVMTRPEYERYEKTYWQENTAIGYVFALGTAVGFLVGSVICYQILYTNVATHLPQFATLKAIGYGDAYLVGVILQQAVFMALLGFVPAVAASWCLYNAVGALTGLLMKLTVLRLVLVLALTVAMCMVAGILAVRKVLQADPAEIF